MLTWSPKDPDEVLDYTMNWGDRLVTDTIATSTWIMSPDNPDLLLTTPQNSKTNTVTTLWLAGGTLNAKYKITNRIVTAGGRTMDQSVRIQIKEK